MSSTAASSPTRGPTTTRGLEDANLPSSRSRSSALSFPTGSGGIGLKYRRGVGRGQDEQRELPVRRRVARRTRRLTYGGRRLRTLLGGLSGAVEACQLIGGDLAG